MTFLDSLLTQKIKSLSRLVVLGAVFLMAILSSFQSVPVEAQSINDLNILGVQCFFPGQEGCGDGRNLYDIVLNFALDLAPFLAILVIIWGGYKYLFSGLPGEQEDGKKTVEKGVIGLVIVLVAQGITAIVQGFISSDGGEGFKFNDQFLIGQVDRVSGFLFALVGAIAVGVIIWGGYKYLFSGLPGEQEDGKKSIQNGLIGLVVVLIARPLTTLVRNTFGSTTADGEQSAELQLQTGPILATLTSIINNFLIPLSSVVTVFFFVLGAYYIITARGDSSREEAGRNAIRNAIIGLVVLLLATTIVQLIIYFIPRDLPS